MDTTVVILGGGYAGVMAANRLAASGRPGLEVVLVTPAQRFVERIRLHQYAAGTRADATVDFSSILHPAVRCVEDSAVRIQADGRRIQLLSGDWLDYDYLIYAVGSSVAAAPQGALRVEQLDGAAAARRDLAALPAGGTVAVVGGGLTAVETAAETARAFPGLRVALHSAGPVAPRLGIPAQRTLEQRLRKAGVRLHIGRAVSADGDVRRNLAADVVLWCAGFAVPPVAAASGLPVNAEGRLRLEPTLQVPGQERIYGAGDAAVIDGYSYLRMSCAAALPMGADAAGNILRALDGTDGVRHDSGFRGVCISLGRKDAVVQFLAADDTPARLHLSGRSAALQKELICRMTLRWIRGEAKRSGAYTWPTGPKVTLTDPSVRAAG